MANGHGGRRKGAGRPAGTGWKPRVATLRKDTVEKMQQIIASDADPLTVVAGWVVNEGLSMETRLSAAAVCLPFLYPKLSASTVDARVTTTTVDATRLIERLNERLERLAAEPVPVIDAKPAEPDEGDKSD